MPYLDWLLTKYENILDTAENGSDFLLNGVYLKDR